MLFFFTEPAVACHISHESLRERETPTTAKKDTYPEMEKSCSPSLPNLQTRVRHKPEEILNSL